MDIVERLLGKLKYIRSFMSEDGYKTCYLLEIDETMALIKAQSDEIDRLRSDVTRQMAITTEQSTEIERLRALVETSQDSELLAMRNNERLRTENAALKTEITDLHNRLIDLSGKWVAHSDKQQELIASARSGE